MAGPVFQARGVRKVFEKSIALDGVSLAIEEARTTVLIGPSGCGKSTLLKLFAGLLTPDAGEVRFRGEPLLPRDDERSLERRRRLGYVVQGGGLFPHLTAQDNAALVARHLRVPAERIDARLGELCELTRLPRESLGRYPGQLSGGQAQRVGLIRALLLDPEVLLLDEPLGALDPITRYELQADLLRAFAQLKKTVVLVTHDLAEAAFFGHRLALLRAGTLVQEGTVEDLVQRPAAEFVTKFLRAQRAPVTA